MMGKTHLAAGVAASLLVTQPKSYEECILALIGGSIGGVLADIDILDNDSSDSLKVQLTAMGLTFVLLMVDSLCHFGICTNILSGGLRLPMIGLFIFAVLWLLGVLSPHRTFTHSFLALAVYSAAVYLVYPLLTLPFAVGYGSHLALDVLNKRRLPLFYPLKRGFCLKLCYANRLANKLFFSLSCAVALLMLSLFFIQIILPLI